MKTAIFTFGRFNPITIGHEKLINYTIKHAPKIGADPYLFTSQSFDSKKNPMNYHQKIHWLNRAFPQINVIKNKKIANPFQAMEWLIEDNEYEKIVLVVGGDRVAEFTSRIKKWFSKQYKDIELSTLSAGSRADVKINNRTVSGSLIREYAYKNQFDKFAKCVPASLSGPDTLNMFYDVRAGMGLKKSESTDICTIATKELRAYLNENKILCNDQQKMPKYISPTIAS